MKRLLLITVIAISLVCSMAASAHADRAALLAELVSAGIVDGGPDWLAGYLTDQLWDNSTGMRDTWLSAGLVTVTASPYNVTLSDYAKATGSNGYSTIYNMKVLLKNAIRDAISSLYGGSVPSGIAESKAEYLFMDASMKDRWKDSGIIQNISYYNGDTTKPTYMELSTAGQAAILSMQTLSDAFVAAGVSDSGSASAYAEWIFTDSGVRDRWLDAGLINVVKTGAIVTSVNLTDYGTATAGYAYSLSNNMALHGMEQWAAERIALQIFGDTNLRELLVTKGLLKVQTSSQGYAVWGLSSATDPADDSTYLNLGAPLGVKSESWVLNTKGIIAPVASFLALDVAPQEAMANINTMIGYAGVNGKYGPLDAFTVAGGSNPDVAQVYLTVNQGMTLISIANCLQNGAVQSYFSSSSTIQASSGVLNENFTGLSVPTGLNTARTLSAADETTLRSIAAKTWSYFADTVTSANHWLPANRTSSTGSPDTYTSITDIAMYMMSIVSAKELGIITNTEAQTRMTNVINTLSDPTIANDKWHGLFRNYYGMADLLSVGSGARFISTVDNGWLASGLIVAKQAFPGLAANIDAILNAMEFDKLYNSTKGQFVTGADENGVLTGSTYGLAYTEIRPTLLVAIGLGDIPASAWDNTATTFPSDWTWQSHIPDANGYYSYTVNGQTVKYIPSWDGTMFEAFMPNLVINNRTLSENGYAIQDAAYLYLQMQYATGAADAGYTTGSDAIELTSYGQTAVGIMGDVIDHLTGLGVAQDTAIETAILLFSQDGLRTSWSAAGDTKYINVTYSGSQITNITFTSRGDLALPAVLSGDGMPMTLQVHNAILANDLQDEFAAMYKISVADQVLGNTTYKDTVSGIGGWILSNSDFNKSTYFTISDFVRELTDTCALHSALSANSNALREIFASISGISVADQISGTDVYRGYLAGVTGGAGYALTEYVATLSGPNNVHLALEAGTLRADFALLYKIASSDQTLSNTSYRSILDGVAGYISGKSGYTISDWTTELLKSASLHRSLDSNNLRDIFEGVSGIPVSDQVSITDVYRGYLAGIVSGLDYDKTKYIVTLQTINAVHVALNTNNFRTSFAAMYKIPVANQVLTNETYMARIQGIASYIVSTSGWTITRFTTELRKTAALHQALADNRLRIVFAAISDISVADQVNVTDAYRGYLAGIVGEAGYSKIKYIAMLSTIKAVHQSLNTVNLRINFAAMYKVPMAEQVLTNKTYLAKIQGIASYICSNPGYTVTKWVKELTATAALHRALTDKNLGTVFASVSGISTEDQRKITDAYRLYLTNIFNGAGYSKAKYITMLQGMATNQTLAAGALKAENCNSELSDKLDVQDKMQGYGRVADGGFSFTSALASPDRKPTVQQPK